MTWVPNSESILQILFTATWQAALLVLFVWLVVRATGRWITPAWRVSLWAVPMLRLVILVLPALPVSPLPHWISPPHSEAAATPDRDTTDFNPEERPAHLLPMSQEPDILLATRPALPLSQTRPLRLAPIALAIWMAGVLLFAVRWARSSMALRRMLNRGAELSDPNLQSLFEQNCRQSGMSRQVRCVVTEAEIGPATCGLFRPTIVFSRRLIRGLSPSEFEMIVAHELEHIRRLDCLLIALNRLGIMLHWYNPLVYLIRSESQREMELAVDSVTIDRIGAARIREYGELLLRLVQTPARSFPVATTAAIHMARPGRTLHRRVETLVRWRKPHWSQHALGAGLAILVIVIGLCQNQTDRALAQDAAQPAAAQPAAAQSGDAPSDSAQAATTQRTADATKSDRSESTRQATDQPTEGTKRASGRVVDADGNPVANAQLFTTVYTPDNKPHELSTTTNEKGEFSLAYPPANRFFRTYHTWAYADGHGVRVVNMSRAFDGDIAEDVEIRLPPKKSREFQILLPDGRPCTNAVVRPRLVEVPNGPFEADEPTGLSSFLPDSLKPLLSQTSDSLGKVRLGTIPFELLHSLEIVAPSYGKQHFQKYNELFAAPLQLRPVGSVRGKVQIANPERFAGTTLWVETASTSSREGLAETVLDDKGVFEVSNIATGHISIQMSWPSDSEYHPFLADRVKVTDGETLDLTIDVRPTIPVTGVIRTSDTHEPIAGARISHRYVPSGSVRISNHVVTDDQGRYKTRVATGEIKPQVFSGIVPPYQFPRLNSFTIPPDAESFEADKIRVHPMQLVRGKLVDRGGSPIPGATVVLHTGYRHVAGRGETRPDGSFEMRVRDWELFKKMPRSELWYWAQIDRPALKADPPLMTRLNVLDPSADSLILQRPGS